MRAWVLAALAIAACLVFAAEPDGAQPVLMAPPALRIDPPIIRIASDDGGARRRSIAITLHSEVATTLLTASGDCHCVHLVDTLPLTIPVGDTTLHLGVLVTTPGMRNLTLRTRDGATSIRVQISGPGLGNGATELAKAVAIAQDAHAQLWLVVHDLRGAIRNCGCGPGSLGGVDHLAALPRHLADMFGNTDRASCILTGSIASALNDPEAALVEHGWRAHDPAITVTSDSAALANPSVTAIIANGSTVNHRKIVEPVGDGGMTALALIVDVKGQLISTHVIPIDASLPSDPSVLTAFAPMPQLNVVEASPNASAACATCHAPAFAQWQASAHARAFTSLAPADHNGDCISCHTHSDSNHPTAQAHVQCQTCHQGSDPHQQSNGTTRTLGTISCRSCHDARHDPDFDPEQAWKLIAHSLTN
jgi:hypothetical protein